MFWFKAFPFAWAIFGAFIGYNLFDEHSHDIEKWTKKQVGFVAFLLGPIMWVVAIIGFSLVFFERVFKALGDKPKEKK
jgi:nitrate reductase gamma subunit